MVDNVNASAAIKPASTTYGKVLMNTASRDAKAANVLSAADQSSPAALNKAQTTPAMTTTRRICFHSGQFCQGIWNDLADLSHRPCPDKVHKAEYRGDPLLKELTNLLEDLLHGGLPGAAGDLRRKDSW